MNTEVIQGECSEYLDSLEPEQFHSCITDPPYELGFMDKEWDRSGIAFDPAFWKKVKRVLKPGAHMAVFGGSRTYHRIAVGIEDAGFEIRDSIDWIYAEGFAKSHDISKAIDKRFGKEDDREKIGLKNKAARKDGTMVDRDSYKDWKDNPSGWQERGRDPYERAPATDEAKNWEGWDTQLKPAKEPILIARKPFEGTVAENVLKHGTGGMNIDDARISTQGDGPNATHAPGFDAINEKNKEEGYRPNAYQSGGYKYEPHDDGRWPANVIFDRAMAEQLDEQSGRDLTAGGDVKEKERGEHNTYGEFWGTRRHDSYDDEGGASRYFKQIRYHPEDNIGFFYCPKAKKKERNLGAENDHVTVKPIELVSYLTRLLTPEGGATLDPFAGSGTTGMSAVLEGTGATLVEMDKHYAEIARQRVRYAKTNHSELRREIFEDPSNSITKEQTEVRDHDFW